MIFKPKDFMSEDDCNWYAVTEIANAKLKEWLDAAPTVYAKDPFSYSIYRHDDQPQLDDTVKAKLVFIEEIKK